MSWTKTVNTAGIPQGSFRSIAGYASESLAVGRALLCGYIIFVKAWRDSKYDAVLDVDGELYRIEIKGTGSTSNFSTTSGQRAGVQIIKEKGKSKEKPLNTQDCDWLIATTSTDSYCWIIPVEFIQILQLRTLSIKQIEFFKEKWSVFISKDPNIQPYLKSGFRNLSTSQLEQICNNLQITTSNIDLKFSFDGNNKRLKSIELSYDERLVIAIWEKIFKDLI
jgi:hypothetical protein